MPTFDQIRKFVEAGPGVMPALAPRTYKGADDWCSPRTPATFLGMECGELIHSPKPPSPIRQLMVSVAGKLCQLKVPTFHVGRDLLAAIRQTLPPPGLTWENLRLPHPAGLFLLPRGMVSTPDGRSWDWVAWAITKPGERIKVPGAWEHAVAVASDDGHDMITLATAAAHPSGACDGTVAWNASVKQAGELCKDWNVACDPMGGITPDDHENDTLRTMRVIVANLFLVLQSRPELVERTGERVRTIKSGPAREQWTPNWIGRTYRIQRAVGEGTHASPRLHWRRGHYRKQPCGTGRQDHKIIWIEPHLVGGDADE